MKQIDVFACVFQISNPSKYRVDFRFFAELISVGVFKEKEGLPLLANQLAILVCVRHYTVCNIQPCLTD